MGVLPHHASSSHVLCSLWKGQIMSGFRDAIVHDHKGHSEEKCLRCGWVMGHRALNCMNDDTPHVFPSQRAEIERLRAAHGLLDAINALPDHHDGRWLGRSHDAASYMAGYRLAMRQVKALLHPEAGQS
jgi:hypothetical protein